jgi:hypothetical protein
MEPAVGGGSAVAGSAVAGSAVAGSAVAGSAVAGSAVAASAGESRIGRIVGFLAGCTGGSLDSVFVNIIHGLLMLGECVENGTIDDGNGPPPEFVYGEIPADVYNFRMLNTLDPTCGDSMSRFLRMVPLSVLRNTDEIMANFCETGMSNIDMAASLAVIMAIHFGIHGGSSLNFIHGFIGSSISIAVSKCSLTRAEKSEFMLGCSMTLESIVLDGSVASVAYMVFWVLRELSRSIVRWEIDSDGNGFPNFPAMVSCIMLKVTARTTDAVYSRLAMATLGGYIGAKNLPGNHLVDEPHRYTVERFVYVYENRYLNG